MHGEWMHSGHETVFGEDLEVGKRELEASVQHSSSFRCDDD